MGISRTQVVKYVLDSTRGPAGEKGAALRGPQYWEDCAVGYNFQAGGNGEQWIDVVIYNDYYYVCKTSHTKTANNYPNSALDVNNGYWQLGDKIDLVATKILLATYALVENLGVSALEMYDDNGNVIVQIKDGNVICNTGTFQNIKITGTIRNPFTDVDSVSNDYHDNVVLLSNAGGWVNAYALPWDVTQSGRRVMLVNYKWGSSTSTGSAQLSAPTGQYFFENGISKNSLTLSREAVELMGYGDSSNFYGWIVTRRIDLMPTYRYGRAFKALAYGSVDSNGNITYTTFDGTTMLASKSSSETGLYNITMPAGWFSSADNVGVMLTGVGYAADADYAPIKATLVSRTTTRLTVRTSDDSTANDGAFDFLIFNKGDWA